MFLIFAAVNILSVENISKSYGVRSLFSSVSFGLEQGQKVALVARNGAGKSTLLNILCGRDIPDTGLVTTRKNIRIGFLDQEPQFDLQKNILESVTGENVPEAAAMRRYEDALESGDVQRIQDASAEMDHLAAWDFESRVKTMLGRLGLQRVLQKVETLSGGQRKRLALARVLLSDPDFLILDEPTNHLDIDMIEWLENYLASSEKTLLLVTHDRYFLDRVCEEIIELENGTTYRYRGNFSYYIQRKAEREEAENASIEKARNLYRRELEWVRKMPRARGTKAKARVDAFDDVKEEAKKKKKEDELQLQVKMSRLGGKILELIKIRKSFGEQKILDGFEYTFRRGEKIGIVGRNGTGKSTLLNIIMGTENIDGGKIQTGETVVFGYYAQQGLVNKDHLRVIEVVKEIAEYFPLADGSKLSASQMLQRFLFPPESQYSFVEKLSGGEKRRLYLLTVLMKNPNFLILDEPTNDLDILTLGILEDFLVDFPGCVLIVSHDRYFMDKLVDHLFVFEGEGVIRDFPGNYSQWREKQQEVQQQAQEQKRQENASKKEESRNVPSQKKKLSFKEKYEYEQLEKSIAALEKEKAELTEEMNAGPDHETLHRLSSRFAEIETSLESQMLRWMELAENME